jgi:hypothetical protein
MKKMKIYVRSVFRGLSASAITRSELHMRHGDEAGCRRKYTSFSVIAGAALRYHPGRLSWILVSHDDERDLGNRVSGEAVGGTGHLRDRQAAARRK